MSLVKLNARSATALDATVLTGNLPRISGASLTGITTGKILQTVFTKQSGDFQSTSSSFTDVISRTITLSATSSKVLIQCFIAIHATRDGDQLYGDYKILRDSTAIIDREPEGGNGFHGRYLTTHNSSARAGQTHQLTWNGIDSPSSTSEITYKLQSRDVNNGGNSSYADVDGCYLILSEIGA